MRFGKFCGTNTAMQGKCVFDGFEGRGIARQMVLSAVDFARLNSRFIVPVCSYARALLTRTDEYKDILV